MTLFTPLSACPRIPVGLEVSITQDLEIFYERHYYLMIPRTHFTTNPETLLAMVPTLDFHTFHSPNNTLDINPTTILTSPLDPKELLGEFNAELEYRTHGNRAQDSASYRLQQTFETSNTGPLRNSFPHHANLPHCFTEIVSGDRPDDDD